MRVSIKGASNGSADAKSLGRRRAIHLFCRMLANLYSPALRPNVQPPRYYWQAHDTSDQLANLKLA